MAVPSVDQAAHRRTGLSYLDDWARRRRWVIDAALAAALALVLLPTSVALVWGAGWPTVARVALVSVLLLGHLTVVARRVRPAAAYATCCLVMLTLVVAPDIAGDGASGLAGETVPPILLPSALVFPVVLYSVAAYARRPWPSVALLVGLVGAVMTTVRLAMSSDEVGGPVGGLEGAGWQLFVVAGLVAAVLAPWALGMFRGVRAAYVDALEERAVRAERDRAERVDQAAAAERARIAREMHDVVAHSLAVIVRQAEGGRFAAGKDPQLAVRALSTVAATGREALADMRTVLGVLRGDEDRFDDPQPTVDDIPAMVARLRGTGLAVDLATTGTPLPLDRAVTLAAYRVVQEALTNVVKHAGPAATASVRLEWAVDGLDIAVEDNGEVIGSSSGPVETTGGQGLVGMRERVAIAGGRLDAGPREGLEDSGGFAVRAHLPSRARGGPG